MAPARSAINAITKDRSPTNGIWVAGVDGFKHRWCAVLWQPETGEFRARITETFAGLLSLEERPSIVAVDIPIGLPELTPPGGRACEAAARKVLGPRRSSVFSAIGRTTLESATRLAAHEYSVSTGGIGVGAQAWGLSKKLLDADAAMTREHERTVFEVHPEVSFWAMQGEVPMSAGKKTSAGIEARKTALEGAGFPPDFIRNAPTFRVGVDDFLDACAAAWTANRILTGHAGRFPLQVKPDSRGVDTAIWF